MTEAKKEHKTLVLYFSASGMTKRVAEEAARVLKADIFEIRPAEPYTAHDLDYIDKSTRVWVEHRNPKARPAYAGDVANWKDYDTVLIGYPLWWAEAPHVVYTFVESHDFSGKHVISFSTAASTDQGDSGLHLGKAAGSGTWDRGIRFYERVPLETVDVWAQKQVDYVSITPFY